MPQSMSMTYVCVASCSPALLHTRSLTVSERSSHSGDVNWQFPARIMRSISICFRCQNGGDPASSVYMITPALQLWKHQFILDQSVSYIPEVQQFKIKFIKKKQCFKTRQKLYFLNLHIHCSAIAWMMRIHGALNDFWSQITWCSTYL